MDKTYTQALLSKEDIFLVAIIHSDYHISQFVVCRCYEPSRPYGNQWCWGHYFFSIDDAVDYFRERTGD